MRFASLLLLGLLAIGLHAAESKRVMQPVRLSYQAPPPAERMPLPPVPPEEGAAVEHEIVEADPLNEEAAPPTVTSGETSDVDSALESGCGCQDYQEVECDGCIHCCPGGGLHGHHRCAYCSRCNMPQHMPYFAQPSTYYYFRPYNHLHIPLIQQEAMLHGATTQNPYDTNLFEDVYREFDGHAFQGEETLISP